jgi:hypothetical protein
VQPATRRGKRPAAEYARTDAIGNACAIVSSEKTWVAQATALSVGSLALSWELGGLVEIVYLICRKVSKQDDWFYLVLWKLRANQGTQNNHFSFAAFFELV